MNNETALEVAEIAAALARIPGVQKGTATVSRDAVELTRLARRAVTNATNYCILPNYGDTFDKRNASIQKAAEKILTPYGLRAKTTGDPRGSCFRIKPLADYPEWETAPEHFQRFAGEDGFRL